MGDSTYLPQIVNIADHKQGDTFVGLRFTVTQNDVAKDLTGATITMTFLLQGRRNSSQETLTLGSGLTLVDGPTAVFDMDEQDINWTAGEYWYECEIIYSDGLIKTTHEGSFTIVVDKKNNS